MAKQPKKPKSPIQKQIDKAKGKERRANEKKRKDEQIKEWKERDGAHG